VLAGVLLDGARRGDKPATAKPTWAMPICS
jgi:hypothetical protein